MKKELGMYLLLALISAITGAIFLVFLLLCVLFFDEPTRGVDVGA